MDPAGIAAVLRELATYLELEDDRFRAGAYARAARSIDNCQDLTRLIAERRLTELPGVGTSVAALVEELVARGTAAVLERLRARWPHLIVELSRQPRVGASKARQLHEALSPVSLDDVAAMCARGQVRALPGFGKVSEARLAQAIAERHLRREQLAIEAARAQGEAMAGFLRGDPAVLAVVACGPARRWVEIVDELAVAVATEAPAAVRARLRQHPLVVALDEVDADVAMARLASGVRCALHTAPPARFGVALITATGDAGHVAGLRQLAAAGGVDLDTLIAPDEAAVYRALGLPELPPEVRDGTDELAAARAGDRFADLVTLADVRGAVHCHTTYSDGRHSVEEMARAAEARGLDYITITDHSQSAAYAGGLTPFRLQDQAIEMAAVQDRVGIRLLRGTESDILEDGRLDYDGDVLAELDVVIASIHRRHGQDEDGMTRRLVAMMRQPVFKIWGHALGRLLLVRDPVPCRFDEVLDAVADAPVAIEINGDPRRLDLDPVRARAARARGARFVLSSDAHSIRGLDALEYAVAMARRARLRPADVLNTLPVEQFAAAVRPQPSPASG